MVWLTYARPYAHKCVCACLQEEAGYEIAVYYQLVKSVYLSVQLRCLPQVEWFHRMGRMADDGWSVGSTFMWLVWLSMENVTR
jgi:hypothetical protein